MTKRTGKSRVIGEAPVKSGAIVSQRGGVGSRVVRLELESEAAGARMEFWVKNAKDAAGPLTVEVAGKRK